MSVLALAAASFRRLYRDRTALFFMLVLPVVIILVIGTVADQPGEFRVGVADRGAGGEGGRLTALLASSRAVRLERFDDDASARTALRRGELDTVVILPAGMDADLAAGRQVEVAVLADRANATHRAAAQAVGAVVSERAARLAAAAVHQRYAGGDREASAAAVAAVAPGVAPIEVRTRVVDAESGYLPSGFGYSAPTMLVLFVFITSLAGGGAMIESRRLGIHGRMLASPVTPAAIVVGESLSYLLAALLQSLIIVGLGALLFGVSWGDPLAATALVLVWALVGTGTGMLAGTLFRTAEQASAIGTMVGMAAGMLGGTMWPLEIVGPVMRAVGHVVPHAWAVEAWIEILSRGGGLADVAPQLAVLAGFAVVLLGASSVRLRHRLSA
ncbi:MAG TPA: ABC transporter permease [Acidimicrobiales bacterium]|nr:ABC transporter permease [Acidimicrobiales bacterium]